MVEGDLAFTLFTHTQPAFTRHLIIETLEQGVEYVQVNNKDTTTRHAKV